MTGRALVVDDNAVNRRILRRGLAEQGIEAIEAPDGLHARELLEHEAIDIVLLDPLMPRLDGYETLERIKSREALRHVPVIVITAVDDIEIDDARQARKVEEIAQSEYFQELRSRPTDLRRIIEG